MVCLEHEELLRASCMVKLIVVKEFLERYSQGMSNFFHVHNRDVPAACLHSCDVAPIQIGSVGKVFLRHTFLLPQLLDALPQTVSYVLCVHIAKVELC